MPGANLSEIAIYGIIGYPLSHTLSPVMHNTALQACGLSGIYLPFPVVPERLAGVIEAARTLGIRGFNVTIPHKESIIPYLDEVDGEARECGAVNTVCIKDDKAWGYNTDGAGFMAALREAKVDPGGLVVILGAGGAARAIGYNLARSGCELAITDLRPEKAEILAADINAALKRTAIALEMHAQRWKALLKEAQLVINTTPVGMYPRVNEMPPLDLKAVNHNAVICDIVYNPVKTRLLKEAEQKGFKTVGGVGMLVHQGAISFRLFTGHEAPLQVMREAVLKGLNLH